MAPTLFYERGYRFFFFSREELRMHVHVSHPDGEAKFWLAPSLSLAWATGLSAKQLREVEKCVRNHQSEIEHAWNYYFSS
jgi:hypothetical protein